MRLHLGGCKARGSKYGRDSNVENPQAAWRRVDRFIDAFKDRWGAVTCRELTGLDVANAHRNLTMKGLIQPMDFAKLGFPSTLKRAHEEPLTFYDASYITATKNAEAVPITEDEELQKAAGRFVKTITYTDFEGRLAPVNGGILS